MGIAPFRLNEKQRLALRIVMNRVDAVVLSTIDYRGTSCIVLNFGNDLMCGRGDCTRKDVGFFVSIGLANNIGVINQRSDYLEKLSLNLRMLNLSHTLLRCNQPRLRMICVRLPCRSVTVVSLITPRNPSLSRTASK